MECCLSGGSRRCVVGYYVAATPVLTSFPIYRHCSGHLASTDWERLQKVQSSVIHRHFLSVVGLLLHSPLRSVPIRLCRVQCPLPCSCRAFVGYSGPQRRDAPRSHAVRYDYSMELQSKHYICVVPPRVWYNMLWSGHIYGNAHRGTRRCGDGWWRVSQVFYVCF